jgi:hypothetical protein
MLRIGRRRLSVIRTILSTMPHTPDLQILRAWRHTGEVGRIHYVVRTHDNAERHLYVDETSGLGKVLDAALLAQGYTGPKSAQEH